MSNSEKDVVEIYHEIGQFIVDAIPVDFQYAWAGCEMLDDVWGLDIFFRKSNNRYGYISDDLDDLYDNFWNLRKVMSSHGDKWTTATFMLSNSGKMEIDFGYEDISDFSKDCQRRKDWIEKYIGSEDDVDWPPMPQ